MNWSVEDRNRRMQSLFYLLGVAVFFIGFLRFMPFLLFIGLFFIVLGYTSEKYMLYLTRHLMLINKKTDTRLSIGENGELTLMFTNTSRLPFFSIQGELEIDAIAEFRESTHEHPQIFTFTFSIPAGKTISITCPITAISRGTARIRSFQLTCEDPLHICRVLLRPNELIRNRLIIYPKPLPVANVSQLRPRHPGFDPAAHALFHDDTAPSGTRDYLTSDPFRYIHWKASARSGRLQTKVFEKVAHLSWCFVFLTDPGNTANRTTDDFEKRISATAYMTKFSCQNQISYSIYCNNKPMGKKIITELEEGHGTAQLRKAWEFLAFMQKWQIKAPVDQSMRAIDQVLSRPQTLFIMDWDRLSENSPYLLKWLNFGHVVFFLHIEGDALFFSTVPASGGEMSV